MDSIQIDGGIPLQGQVRIQGSKNAALPVLAATILIHGKSYIENCPKIKDFSVLKELKNLELLQLYGKNELPDLSFIRHMKNLKTF